MIPMMKRNSKIRWLVFICIVLIIAIAIFFVVLPTKSKIRAPQSESTASTSTQNVKGTATTDGLENKGQIQTQTTPIDNDPNSTDPYYFYDLGNSKLASKDYQVAIDYFNRALALNQLDSKFYVKKSETLVSLGKKAEAIDTINQGLAKLPNDESLLTQLDILKNVVK